MTTHKTLVQALAQAQSEMDHANLDETNPQFKSKFASLKSVIDAVKPALNNNGIWFLQKSIPTENGIAIETVFYGYGEEISTGPVPVPAQRATPQGYGSAITYAKRYSLAMACGISAAQDDDGNQAEEETPENVDFKDLGTSIEGLGDALDKNKKSKMSAEDKPVINDNPANIEEARIAVDSLIDLIRAWCSSEKEIRNMLEGNKTLTDNLKNNFPDERERLRNAMGVFVKQLGEKK